MPCEHGRICAFCAVLVLLCAGVTAGFYRILPNFHRVLFRGSGNFWTQFFELRLRLLVELGWGGHFTAWLQPQHCVTTVSKWRDQRDFWPVRICTCLERGRSPLKHVHVRFWNTAACTQNTYMYVFASERVKRIQKFVHILSNVKEALKGVKWLI